MIFSIFNLLFFGVSRWCELEQMPIKRDWRESEQHNLFSACSTSSAESYVWTVNCMQSKFHVFDFFGQTIEQQLKSQIRNNKNHPYVLRRTNFHANSINFRSNHQWLGMNNVWLDDRLSIANKLNKEISIIALRAKSQNSEGKQNRVSRSTSLPDIQWLTSCSIRHWCERVCSVR